MRQTRGHGSVCLEQAPHERGIHRRIVGSKQGVGDVRVVALAGVVLSGEMLGEARCLPPHGQPHRVESQLLVPGLLGDVSLEVEELLPELTKPLSDIEVVGGDTQPDAFGVQRAVTHEVAEEFGQFGGHMAGDGGGEIAGPVRLTKGRERYLARLTHELVELERNEVSRFDIPKPLPDPGAIRLYHLDPMSWCSLDPVAASGLHCDDRLDAVDDRTSSLLGPFVGANVRIEILPLGTVRVAQRAKAYQPALRRYQRSTDKATGRSNATGLSVAVAVLLAQFQGEVPAAARRLEQVGRSVRRVDPHDMVRQPLVLRLAGAICGAPVVAHHPQHRLAVLGKAREWPHRRRHLGRRGVGDAGEDGGEGAGDGAARLGVIGDARPHQEAAQVGVPQTERAVPVRAPGDLLGGEVGHGHRDLEHDGPQPDGMPVCLDVDDPGFLVEELHQVDRGEVARRVVDENIFRDMG